MPANLTPDEAAIWRRDCAHALAELTLTPGTVEDFAEMCRLEVERASLLSERRTEGWTARGLALAKEYRGIVQRIEAKRRAFRLAPMGKPMLDELPADEDPFDAFDGAVN